MAQIVARMGGAKMTDEQCVRGRPKEWTDDRIQEEAEALISWFEEDDSRYWLKSFAIERGYSPPLLNYLCDKSDVFAEAHAHAHSICEERLVELGMSGVEPGRCNFVLNVLRHGRPEWDERKKNEITGAEGKPFEIQVVDVGRRDDTSE